MTEPNNGSSTHGQSETPQAQPQGKTEIDLGSGFQAGLDALGKALSGIVKAAKEAIGPDMLRNLAAGQLFQQIATCLDEIVAALEKSQPCPAQKKGELTCYIEQLDSEIKGSKFEGQKASLQDRLDGLMKLLGEPATPDTTRRIAEAAGYFHAAAKSAMPVSGGGDPVHFEYKNK